LFAQAEIRLPDFFRTRADSAGLDPHDVVAVLGYRTDDHSVFGREGSPYAGLRAEVARATLHGSYGEGFRAPKPGELFDAFIGNADLGPETSQSLDAGVSREFFGDALTLGATWFRLDVDGLIAYDASATTPSRPFGQLTNFARTRTTGFEYEARADLGCGFRARAAYTTQNPRDRDTGLPLPNRARRFGSAGVSWEGGDVLVSLDGFFSGSNGNQGGEFTAPDGDAREHPGRRSVVDLSLSWRASDTLTVFGGVRNLLDDDWVATPSSPRGNGIGVYAGASLEF
jgi:vitamin B12 transporter